MGFLSRMRLAALASLFASALAPSASAADDASAEGTRLQYTRGPRGCLSETDFRREVAIAGDGEDHFGTNGPDVLRVWFEKLPDGRFRGTAQYTDAAGQKKEPAVEVHDNCEVLGRWVAVDAYYDLPKPAQPADPVPQARKTWPPPPPPPLPPQRFPPPAPPAPLSPLGELLRLLKRMDLSIGLSGLVFMTANLTPNVGAGLDLGVDVRGETFSLGVEVRGVLPSTTYAREPTDPKNPYTRPQEFDLSLVSGLLVPCGRWKYLVGCGVAQIGAVIVATSRSVRPGITFSAGPRVGVEVPFAERFAVFGFGEALFAAVRANPTFGTANVSWVQPLVSGYFGVGASVKFQ